MLGQAMTAVVTTATSTFNTVTSDDLGLLANGNFNNINFLSATGNFSLKFGADQSAVSILATSLPLSFEGTTKGIYLQSASSVVTISMLVAVVEPMTVG